MAVKLAITQVQDNYSYALAGRRILVAPANTALPATITPITDENLPAGWVDLGPVENAEVTLTLTRQTEKVQTGLFPTDRRIYITGQEGTMEANLFRYEPGTLQYAAGVTPEAAVAASGGNRRYIDIFLGGTLGPVQSLLCFEDFDIPLVEDADSGESYEQVWHYSPNAQADGDIDLSRKITKAPSVPVRFTLLGFTNASAGDRTLLLHERWLCVA